MSFVRAASNEYVGPAAFSLEREQSHSAPRVRAGPSPQLELDFLQQHPMFRERAEQRVHEGRYHELAWPRRGHSRRLFLRHLESSEAALSTFESGRPQSECHCLVKRTNAPP